jgi:hypothetical protein
VSARKAEVYACIAIHLFCSGQVEVVDGDFLAMLVEDIEDG